MSLPPLTPLSNSRGNSLPNAFLINGNASIAAVALSNCLPPWLDTCIASTPSSFIFSASSGYITPLIFNFPFQASLTLLRVPQSVAPLLSLLTNLLPLFDVS